MKTQVQMFYDAERKSASLNDMMLDLMRNQEITNAELAALIKRRPMVYERFAGFVGKIVEEKS